MSTESVLPTLAASEHDDFVGAADEVALDASLAAVPTKKARIEFLCGHLGDATTDEIRTQLARHGQHVSRQYVSAVVNEWRRVRHPDDWSGDEIARLRERDTAGDVDLADDSGHHENGSRLPVASVTMSDTDFPSVVRDLGGASCGCQQADDVPAPVGALSAGRNRAVRPWPVLLLALPAFVAVWSGWVGLGQLTGFGVVHPLPGIWDAAQLNTAITLPIGMEAYASYALYVWLSGRIRKPRTISYARWSACGSLLLGAAGQVAYHLMEAAGMTAAPWSITLLVACVPVVVLGMGAALAHMILSEDHVG